MKFGRRTNSFGGFTRAEVLAALLFMASVVAVAMEGLHIASRAGAVAQRKGEAARIAQRVLTENLVSTNWNQSVQSGSTTEGQREFPWTLHSDPWTQDPAQNLLPQPSVDLTFPAQDRQRTGGLSALGDSSLMDGTASTTK